jgi:hypothetical protein
MLEVAKTRGCSILQSWNFGGECGEYGCKAQRSIGGIFNWSVRNACGNAPGVFWPEMGLRCAGAMTGAADGFAAKMEGGRDWTLVQVTAGISA